MTDFPPKKPSNLAPGMTMPVVAGEEYTITDQKGESAVIEARDDPLTIAFIHAYDEWIMLARAGMTSQQEWAGAILDAAFEALPRRIKDNLPSRRAGIVIPGRFKQ